MQEIAEFFHSPKCVVFTGARFGGEDALKRAERLMLRSRAGLNTLQYIRELQNDGLVSFCFFPSLDFGFFKLNLCFYVF